MKFEVRKPDTDLRPWVECYWNVELNTGPNDKTELILPNGKIEMIFALEGNYKMMNRRTRSVNQSWLSGCHYEPLEINYRGKSNLIGIRFYPHGIFPFLEIPIGETVNQVDPLHSIWGVFQKEMYEALYMVKENAEIYPLLDQFLIRKISEEKTRQYKVITGNINQLKVNPNQSIPTLADSLGFTQRHLTRIFHDHTGVNPKLLAQVYRFEKAYSSLYSHSHNDVADLISQLGYYDQSHFNKEFKRFSGMSPGEYKRRASGSDNFLS
ncbi:AraC family transcriptional regulator [Rossellomorea sp. DUT-2]|uniref:AraC family transcriptional regulator n=1 Tax=Rossellomorea sp. DUT-2 TaxID=3412021 RepID=UPI003D18576C